MKRSHIGRLFICRSKTVGLDMQQNCIIKKIDLSYQEPSAITKPWATSVDAQGSFQKRIHNESNGLNSKEKFRLVICLHLSGPKEIKKHKCRKKQ